MSVYNVRCRIILTFAFFVPGLAIAEASPENQPITEILIHGIPQPQALYELPTSATILDAHTISQQGASDFSELIDTVPGLNFAGGATQPRFFQIRGIGEFEQYEGVPNPSIGVRIDNIDVSGLGVISSLFDVDQVEVLRGPQSTGGGASALAGSINVRSREPSTTPQGLIQLGGGNDALFTSGIAVGGPVVGTDGSVRVRISSSSRAQNGFRSNEYLHRDDTNQTDEHTTRLRVTADPNPDLNLDATLLAIRNQNRYDAFTITNTFTTQSDRPGEDETEATGASLVATLRLNPELRLESTTSVLNAHQDYSYDGDWGNPTLWAPYHPYDYFSRTDRDRTNLTQELRLRSDAADYRHGDSTRWVAGVFGSRFQEDTAITDSFEQVPYRALSSSYDAITTAAFGEVEYGLGMKSALTLGLRDEHRSADYTDTHPADLSPSDTMPGGNISLSHDFTERLRWYLTLARGFKGGGVNPGTRVPDEQRTYDPEYQWSLESGVKGQLVPTYLEGQLALFRAWRHDAQLKFAFQNDPSDPLAFTYITQSAATATSSGLEGTLSSHLLPYLTLFGSGSVIDASYTSTPEENSSLEGRAPSHTPRWQYSFGTEVNPIEHWFARLEQSGRDSIYFDDSHNEQGDSYHLTQASLGYRAARWSAVLWARNIFNERYATRGFYFGNEPPDFAPKKYLQLGDPMTVGVTLTVAF